MRSLAALLLGLALALVACAPGPQWVNLQAFAAPQSPSVSYVAVYEPWSRNAVVTTKNGEVLPPILAIRARCVNITCASTTDGVYIDKKPTNVDHVEIVVEAATDSGLEPVHLSIPFGDTTPIGMSYVVVFRKKVAP